MTKLLDTNNYIIAFDIDGTLVNTDKANSMAYQRSVYDVTGITIDIENCRITRDSLKTKINVSDNILQEIIIKKEQLFAELLLYTQPLPALFILQHLKKTHNVLLTYARQVRAYSVLEYLTIYIIGIVILENLNLIIWLTNGIILWIRLYCLKMIKKQ